MIIILNNKSLLLCVRRVILSKTPYQHRVYSDILWRYEPLKFYETVNHLLVKKEVWLENNKQKK